MYKPWCYLINYHDRCKDFGDNEIEGVSKKPYNGTEYSSSLHFAPSSITVSHCKSVHADQCLDNVNEAIGILSNQMKV